MLQEKQKYYIYCRKIALKKEGYKMKKYTNNKKINKMFKNAIDKNALKKAMNDPQVVAILNKIKY